MASKRKPMKILAAWPQCSPGRVRMQVRTALRRFLYVVAVQETLAFLRHHPTESKFAVSSTANNECLRHFGIGTLHRPTAKARPTRCRMHETTSPPGGGRIPGTGFSASYRLVFIILFQQKGISPVANWITDSLAVLVLFVVLWARISLGKKIGFVPAQRVLVSSGAHAATPHDMGSQGYARGHDTNMRVILGP
jgi:hypothetical protein